MKIQERNLNSMRNEALRQFNEQSKILERYSNISHIIMGFIIASLAYYFFVSDVSVFIKNIYFLPFFLFATMLIIVSFIFIFKAFKLENFYLGSKMSYLISELSKNKKVDLRIKNLKILLLMNKKNSELIKIKSKNIRISLWSYFIGFLIFIIIKFIYLLIN